jgi:hypothetical protein
MKKKERMECFFFLIHIPFFHRMVKSGVMVVFKTKCVLDVLIVPRRSSIDVSPLSERNGMWNISFAQSV